MQTQIHKKTSYLYLIAYHILVPKGEDGSVEVSVKLKGYNQEVLAKNDVQDPVRMWDFLYAVIFPCYLFFMKLLPIDVEYMITFSAAITKSIR